MTNSKQTTPTWKESTLAAISSESIMRVMEGFRLLVETLDENDRVSILTYAGSSAVVLDSAPGSDKERILSAYNVMPVAKESLGKDEGNYRKDFLKLLKESQALTR